MSKVQLKVLNHKKVQEVSDERGSDAGIWVYLKPGFHTGENEHYDDRLHAVHENTWSESYKMLQGCKPCDCPDCVQLMEKAKQ